MHIRYGVVGSVAAASLIILGATLFFYGTLHAAGLYHGLRYIISGATLAATGAIWGAVLALGWRHHVLTEVFREGYRQGRRDANAALFEEGCTVLGVLDPYEHNGGNND